MCTEELKIESEPLKAIVISVSSDIGKALALRWVQKGWDVVGTVRSEGGGSDFLAESGVRIVRCDLSNDASVGRACTELCSMVCDWDVLVVCTGTLEPIGLFSQSCFDELELSFRVNFVNQLRIVHRLLPFRNRERNLGACVLFFAGGGTNSAPVRFSSYTVSKVALIKMTELLDAEVVDTRFVIVGPGWVKTKIHEQTLDAGSTAGKAYLQTKKMLEDGEWTPMARVLDCCDWIIQSPREIVGGRNFSVAHDQWGSEALSTYLKNNSERFKLRRFGNDGL